MAKDTSTGHGDPDFPETTWGTGEGVGSFSTPTGRGNKLLDPRKRCAPPVGGDIKSKRKPKARSTV